MNLDPRTASFSELREFIGEVIASNPKCSKDLWDLMTGLRGPDSPSETAAMSGKERATAYEARRTRKARTVEVIRGHAFGGIVGGAARSRTDRDWVELPPEKDWDHFDRHVERTARVLGLGVRIADAKPEPWAVEAKVMKEAKPSAQVGKKWLGTVSTSSSIADQLAYFKEKKASYLKKQSLTTSVAQQGVYANIIKSVDQQIDKLEATTQLNNIVSDKATMDAYQLLLGPDYKAVPTVSWDTETPVKKEAPSANTLSEADIPF